MKTVVRSLLLALCLGATASAGPPTIDLGSIGGRDKPTLSADVVAKEHGLVRIEAKGVPDGAGLVWRVSPKKDVSRATTPRGLLEFAAPPGDYEVELQVITLKDGKVDVKEVAISVTIERASPKPPAPPPVQPKGFGKLDPPKALAKISFPPFGCTATVIGPRRADGRWDVLTAAHCVSHVNVGTTGQMKMLDGRTFGVTVVKTNAKADYCWMVTAEAVEDLPYANLAADLPPVGTKIWHAGYGVDKPGNREEGTVTSGEDSNGQIRMSISVSSGDSGGGMLRADTDEVISTVCCTRAKGQRADVWGASILQIRAGRPGAVAEGRHCEKLPTFEWSPMEIPLILP